MIYTLDFTFREVHTMIPILILFAVIFVIGLICYSSDPMFS